MKIGTKQITFPDKCPQSCIDKIKNLSQGGICHRCPIFNCSKDADGFSLLEPEDYRDDWAEEYLKYINSEVFYPVCYLQNKTEQNQN